MRERVVTDDDGREVLVRSHTGTVVSVRDVITQGRVEIAISVDPPTSDPAGFASRSSRWWRLTTRC